jgi:hypothetical protein
MKSWIVTGRFHKLAEMKKSFVIRTLIDVNSTLSVAV